ncbi:MAG: apolipoprotein N-acyltransferase [Planctomycetota bacterium]
MTVPIKKRGKFLLMLAGFVLSSVLLTVIQAPFDVHFLAWAAWVPFMLVCGPEVSTRRLVICAYLVGLAHWIGNLYWLQIVSLPGYIAFSFVQAMYWPLLAVCVRFVRRKRWPMMALAPIIFVGAEAIQGVLFTGFHWYYLAHSQYQNLRLIQICDIFGTLGVSVLVAMGNGLFVDLVIHRRQKQPHNGFIGRLTSLRFCELIVFHLLLFSALIYGQYRLNETPQHRTDGPQVGSVQPNVPSHVKEAIESGPQILDDLIADSQACVDAGAELVVWPETMVLARINAEYRYYCNDGTEPIVFHERISDHCSSNGVPVVVGASAGLIGIQNNEYVETHQFNSAFFYHRDGSVDPKRYDKIHLVPFGEFIPMKNTPLYKLFMFFNPYGYDYSLTAGTEYTTFNVTANGTEYGFGVLICYEDTDPTVTRKIVLDENGNKRCDWLVNISNDGWYVFFKEDKIQPTVELAQRTAITVFRCVENRIAVIRSVNTGISCLIEPTGAIRDGYEAGTLPKPAMDRQGVAGWFVDTIPIDDRVTFFSRYGRWLDFLLGAGIMIVLTLSVVDSYKRRKMQKGTKNEKISD